MRRSHGPLILRQTVPEDRPLTIIELLQKKGANVRYNDPFFEYDGRGRKYNLK